MRRRLLIPAFAISVSLSAAAPAAAAAAGAVNFVPCAFAGGSTVPAGAPISVSFAFPTDTFGETSSFLKAVSVTASIDADPIQNAKSYFSAPTRVPNSTTWETTWLYPTGRSLPSAGSMVVTLDLYLTRSTVVGRDPDTHRQVVLPAGSIFGGPVTCTITAN